MTSELPQRIEPDAIIDAIFEIRFEAEPSLVPEIYIGRLADTDAWNSFGQSRLATADIPAPIRRADPKLRYQPAIEMASPDGQIFVKLGPNAISYTRRGQYPGWDVFGSELGGAADRLFQVVPKLSIERLGLRFINVLKSDDHGIKSIDDMDIAISVAGEPLSDSLNLNFKSDVETEFEAMCRIASADLASGNLPENGTMVVDVDVYTGTDFAGSNSQSVKDWLATARIKKNELFFRVLGREATERLRVDK